MSQPKIPKTTTSDSPQDLSPASLIPSHSHHQVPLEYSFQLLLSSQTLNLYSSGARLQKYLAPSLCLPWQLYEKTVSFNFNVNLIPLVEIISCWILKRLKGEMSIDRTAQMIGRRKLSRCFHILMLASASTNIVNLIFSNSTSPGKIHILRNSHDKVWRTLKIME